MAFSQFVALSVLFAAAAAEVATMTQCRETDPSHCSVTQVRITPCANPNACDLPRGKNASLSFDFTPNFSTSNLKTSVDQEGRPFPGLDSNACAYTTCPTQSGVSQTFNYNLYINKKLPPGKYPITWKVWNGDSEAQACCFVATIKLKAPKRV